MFRRNLLAPGVLILALALASQPARADLLPQVTAAGPNAIEIVTTGSNGFGGGSYAALNQNGRLVFFESFAGDLVPGQVDDSWDTFAYDRSSGVRTRVSTRSDGTPVYNPGTYTSPPSVSADGRFVAFVSSASGLVSGDTNAMPDIFLRDLVNRTTVRVSVDSGGGNTNGPSFTPAVSADGRYVVFQSMGSDLVSGDTNGMMDVFVRDMVNRTNRRISVNNSGTQGREERDYGFAGTAISDNGRYIAFSYEYLPFPEQTGSIGPSVYLYDQTLQRARWVAYASMPALSADGRRLVFVTTEQLTPVDQNDSADVYLWDQTAPASFERISIPRNGGEALLQEMFTPPDISDDGRYVVFESNAHLVTGIPEGTANIYLRDRVGQTTQLVSRALDGSPADGESHNPAISGSGTVIAFSSDATNLTTGDANAMSDVFVFTRTAASILPGTKEYYLPLIR